MFWEKLLFVVLAVAAIWFVIRLVRQSPGSFSLANMNRSLFTLGILALALIAFIGILVMWLGPAR